MDKILFWIYIAANIVIAGIILWRELFKNLTAKAFKNLISRSKVDLNEPKKEISVQQGVFLAITSVIATADVFLPGFVAVDAGRDAWLSVAGAGVIYLILLWISFKLIEKFPEENLIMIAKKYLYPIFFIPIALLWLLFLTHKTYVVTREMGEVVINGFLSDTPFIAIAGTVLIIAIYAVKKGLVVIAMSNDFLLTIGLVTLSFVIFMLIGKSDFKEFIPILEHGIKPLIKGAISTLTWLGDSILFLMLAYPYVKNKKKLKAPFFVAAIFLIGALEAGTLAIGIFGEHATQVLIFPALEMVRTVKLSMFLERLEVILITIWIAGIFVKLAFLFYAITDTLQISMQLKLRTFLAWPMAFVIFGMCGEPYRDMSNLLFCLHKVYPYFYFFILFMTIAIYLFALFRKGQVTDKTNNKTPSQSV